MSTATRVAPEPRVDLARCSPPEVSVQASGQSPNTPRRFSQPEVRRPTVRGADEGDKPKRRPSWHTGMAMGSEAEAPKLTGEEKQALDRATYRKARPRAMLSTPADTNAEPGKSPAASPTQKSPARLPFGRNAQGGVQRDNRGSTRSLYEIDTPLDGAHQRSERTLELQAYNDDGTLAEEGGGASLRSRLKVISPTDRRKRYWDIMIVAFALYCALYSPYEASFPPFSPAVEDVLHAMEYITDVAFLVDMVLITQTGYFSYGNVVSDRIMILRNYVRTSLLLDVGSVIVPFVGIMAGGPEMLTLLRMWRISRLRRFSKVVTHGPLLTRILALLFCWLTWAHFVACVWHLLALLPLSVAETTWIEYFDIKRDPTTEYVESLYWAFASMTPMGYARVAAVSNFEKVFAIAVQLTGAVIYAAVFGTITAAINTRDRIESEHVQRLQTVDQFSRTYGLDVKLQNKLSRYTAMRYQLNRGIDPHAVVEPLPEAVQQEVYMQVYLPFVEHVPLFANASVDFLHEIVQKLKPQVCLQGDFVFRKGVLPSAMYLVQRGKFALVVEARKPVRRLSFLKSDAALPGASNTRRNSDASSFAKSIIRRASGGGPVALGTMLSHASHSQQSHQSGDRNSTQDSAPGNAPGGGSAGGGGADTSAGTAGRRSSGDRNSVGGERASTGDRASAGDRRGSRGSDAGAVDPNEPTILTTLMPGASFGEVAMLTRRHHMYSAQALTDGVLFKCGLDDFMEMAAVFPDFVGRIKRRALRELQTKARHNLHTQGADQKHRRGTDDNEELFQQVHAAAAQLAGDESAPPLSAARSPARGGFRRGAAAALFTSGGSACGHGGDDASSDAGGGGGGGGALAASSQEHLLRIESAIKSHAFVTGQALSEMGETQAALIKQVRVLSAEQAKRMQWFEVQLSRLNRAYASSGTVDAPAPTGTRIEMRRRSSMHGTQAPAARFARVTIEGLDPTSLRLSAEDGADLLERQAAAAAEHAAAAAATTSSAAPEAVHRRVDHPAASASATMAQHAAGAPGTAAAVAAAAPAPTKHTFGSRRHTGSSGGAPEAPPTPPAVVAVVPRDAPESATPPDL